MERVTYLWTAMQRRPNEFSFLRSVAVMDQAEGFLEALEIQLLQSAADKGVRLVSLIPDAGWLYKLPSGKEIPCGEHADGARPVWIWRAK